MSMTEQEIRADERGRIADELEFWAAAAPGMVFLEFGVRYIRALKPVAVPEPKITIRWFDHPWDSHNWTVKPEKVATPTPKDWRDVPVTAKMLREAFGPSISNPLCQEESVGSIIERLAREVVAP